MGHRVAKNATWIIACKLAQSVVALIILMISARYLGPSNYGLLNYAASVVTFLLPVMRLGLSEILVQEFIRRPDREGEVLGTAIVMSMMSAAGCMGIVFTFLSVANAGEGTTILVGVLYSFSLLFQATELVQYWFQSKLLSKFPSIAAFIAYVLVAIYKVIILMAGKDVIWFSISNTLDYLVVSLILLIIYHKMGNQKLKVSLSLAKEMFSRSKHYIIAGLMVNIFAQTDRIMLSLMINDTVTGYYSAAFEATTTTMFVFAAIIDSFRPTILEAKNENSPEYESRLIRLYSIITYLSIAQSIAMTLLAYPIVMILYGKSYLPSVNVLQIEAWYVIFSYYGGVRNIWILSENKQKYLWIINLAGAVANIGLNALLIPFMGAMGAALASLLTQFFTNVILGFIIRPIRHNNYLMYKGLNPKPLWLYAKSLLSSLKNRRKNKKKKEVSES